MCPAGCCVGPAQIALMLAQTVMTNSTGSATALIDLGSLPHANATQDGDSLSVTVQWVGPTGELIEQSGSVG